jgi:hypothetical protein
MFLKLRSILFNTQFWVYCLVALLLGLRVWKVGILPYGIMGDEVSNGFEALNLLERGTDKWGHAYPPYFLSWGSGQNTLMAYLMIPFVKIWGFTSFELGLTTFSSIFVST